jgi:hypothetical protein
MEKAEVIKELRDLSKQISVQVRTVALSLLALSWGLLVGTAPTRLQLNASLHVGLVRVGLFAIGVLLLDFLQYLVGYCDSLIVLRKAEAQNLQDVSYDRKAILYRLREWLFYTKIVAVLAVAAYLFSLLLPRVL